MRIAWMAKVLYLEQDSIQTRLDTALDRECMAEEGCIKAVRDMGILEEVGTADNGHSAAL
jgi:hypothetical protein